MYSRYKNYWQIISTLHINLHLFISFLRSTCIPANPPLAWRSVPNLYDSTRDDARVALLSFEDHPLAFKEGDRLGVLAHANEGVA